MAVRDERRAVLLLALLAAAGGVYRIARVPDGPPGGPVIAPEIRGEDVVRQAAASRRAEALSRPLLPGERVDVDQAGAEELERLPRVGPGLARRIVEERDASGPFGSVQGLRRVSGIGPATVASLERWTRFSGVPRPVGGRGGGRDSTPMAAGPGAGAAATGGAGGAAGGERGSRGRSACPRDGIVALNRSSAEELACVRGIGPALAARIVADRVAHGPYSRVEDLDRVRGIGGRLLERLRPFLRAP